MQNSELRLTELSHCAGWAAKLSLEDLVEILKNVPVLQHPNLLVGTETGDDAAVYKINDETALILTVDFFPPITDDPFEYDVQKRVPDVSKAKDILGFELSFIPFKEIVAIDPRIELLMNMDLFIF